MSIHRSTNIKIYVKQNNEYCLAYIFIVDKYFVLYSSYFLLHTGFMSALINCLKVLQSKEQLNTVLLL